MSPFQSQISQKIAVASLKYIDNNVTLDNFVILTPPLEVIFHDLQSGKLILNLADHMQFAVKLNTLQTYLASTLYLHQQTFFGFVNPVLTAEFFKRLIFPLVYNKKLTIFMGASVRTVRVYEKGSSSQGLHRALAAGEKVRIALQLQGISILTTPALSILQSLSGSQMDISGANMCRIRFQQAVRAIYVI